MYGDFPAKNTIYTLYIPINVWFWPTLCLIDYSQEDSPPCGWGGERGRRVKRQKAAITDGLCLCTTANGG